MHKHYWLIEQLKSIKNLADVCLLLIDRDDLLPTVLECLYLESQNATLENCVEHESAMTKVRKGLKDISKGKVSRIKKGDL